ncbi:MAG: methylmalonyl-CoA mutase family protein [Acidobacteria bacterium]|nr:methylmalonyl-CoA mutase family protein [Acidobacteriota bacterium]
MSENKGVPASGRSAPRERKRFETTSGVPVAPCYAAAERPPAAAELPGEPPFTRGIHPTMYRSKLWTMRQYAGFGTARETNERFRYLISQGQTGLSVAFDLPTQIGYDSDHPMATGEVGKVGVAIDSIEDMRSLFAGIPLGRVSTSMTINSTAATLLALYVAVAEEQGVPPDSIAGTVQNDLLKEYISRGTYIYPPAPSLRLTTDIILYCRQHLPAFNPISISGYHMREAGCTAVQEVAFTLADAITYVEAVVARGVPVDEFAPRLSFFFCCHNNIFEEVAKFRAARRMWAGIMKERFRARDKRSMALRFHTQTAGCSLTAQQPEVNVVRVTLQALAAVLGGTQSLHTNAMDEALALPSQNAAQLALRTQQVIAYESGAADTADPLGGSYYVERMTDEIEARATEYIRKIDSMGGMIRCIESGFVQREIQDSSYRYQRSVETGEEVVVGVNRFEIERERDMTILRVPPELESDQQDRLRAFRATRNAAQVDAALNALRSAAAGSDNIMPLVVECVKCGATVGEVSHTLRTVFGEYQERVTV